jgi:hypothetical protein
MIKRLRRQSSSMDSVEQGIQAKPSWLFPAWIRSMPLPWTPPSWGILLWKRSIGPHRHRRYVQDEFSSERAIRHFSGGAQRGILAICALSPGFRGNIALRCWHAFVLSYIDGPDQNDARHLGGRAAGPARVRAKLVPVPTRKSPVPGSSKYATRSAFAAKANPVVTTELLLRRTRTGSCGFSPIGEGCAVPVRRLGR